MTNSDESGAPVIGRVEVRDIDESILKDLESKYADVACPVHGGPPAYELSPDGSVIERFCCETLLALMRELQVAAGERPMPADDAEEEDDTEES